MQAKSLKHLKKVPLFSSVPENELELIASMLKDISFKAGENIINEGDFGNCLYIIRHGNVKVTASLQNDSDSDSDEIVLSFLSKGDYFGEMSLITGDPRSASIIAEDDVDLWQLSKSDFDSIILKNPDITLTLTHMLSQRLKNANKAREYSERYYKSKITPKGSLNETNIIKLLKYAEENSLSGKIHIKQNEKEAYFYYQKGQLIRLDFENKDENEAMDELLEWTKGEFTIEPTLFEIDVKEDENIARHSQDYSSTEIFKIYITEKFSEFIQFAGSSITQTALNKGFSKFKLYFDITKDIKIKAAPEFEIKISDKVNWTEKHTLFMAVLLRDIVSTIGRDVIGMQFWTLPSKNNYINEELEKVQFYDYFDQAVDFVKE